MIVLDDGRIGGGMTERTTAHLSNAIDDRYFEIERIHGEKGEGAIIRRGMSKLAVYRDEHGKLHERSAVCSHLGCIVSWNSLEKTWDCPCNGSSYDRYGRVIIGPANSDLEGVKD